MFEKHPNISKETRAHQENAYFKVNPALSLIFWLSLDDIDEKNGALYYTPGSHRNPTKRHVRYQRSQLNGKKTDYRTFRVRSGVPGLSLCFDGHETETDLPVSTQPGDLLAHHCNTVHGLERTRATEEGVLSVPSSSQRLVVLIKG